MPSEVQKLCSVQIFPRSELFYKRCTLIGHAVAGAGYVCWGQTAWLTGLLPADAWEGSLAPWSKGPGSCGLRPPQPVSSWPVSVELGPPRLGPPSSTSAQSENHQFRLERGCSEACFGGESWRAPRGSGRCPSYKKPRTRPFSTSLHLLPTRRCHLQGRRAGEKNFCFHRLAHFCRLVLRPR